MPSHIYIFLLRMFSYYVVNDLHCLIVLAAKNDQLYINLTCYIASGLFATYAHVLVVCISATSVDNYNLGPVVE